MWIAQRFARPRTANTLFFYQADGTILFGLHNLSFQVADFFPFIVFKKKPHPKHYCYYNFTTHIFLKKWNDGFICSLNNHSFAIFSQITWNKRLCWYSKIPFIIIPLHVRKVGNSYCLSSTIRGTRETTTLRNGKPTKERINPCKKNKTRKVTERVKHNRVKYVGRCFKRPRPTTSGVDFRNRHIDKERNSI